MRAYRGRSLVVLGAALLLVASACGDDDGGGAAEAAGSETADIGVDRGDLSPLVDHPYVAFASLRRTVHEGSEVDGGETIRIRVESTVRDTTATVAGVEVTVVEVVEYEDGERVEVTEDYYAQDSSGAVHYLGERVDEYEDGEISGHGGQWLAGTDGSLAGLFMPARPEVGDEFEQERVPGVAEDVSTVVATGVSVSVPAGSFDDCIQTTDLDPIDDVTEQKFYCAGVGLVREAFAGGETLDLVEIERA